MATLTVETVSVPLGDSASGPGVERALSVYTARPKNVERALPTIIAYPDIFQLTPPHIRMVQRIASYGFMVMAPDIYSKLEGPGTGLEFEKDRQRALDNAAKVQPAWLDEERRALLDYIKRSPGADPIRIGVCGWCFGGHLAFRAALEPEVRAAGCFYATGLHTASLGAEVGSVDTLAQAQKIQGKLLMIWGAQDPHIPDEGRRKIHETLAKNGVRFDVRTFEAEHAFMRDVGPRYDPEAADAAFAQLIDLFGRLSAPGVSGHE